MILQKSFENFRIRNRNQKKRNIFAEIRKKVSGINDLF